MSRTSSNTHATLASFRAYCPLMFVYSILILLFVIVALAGIPLPLDAQTFESSFAIRIVSVIAGILGLVAALIGAHAAKLQNSGQLRLCGALSMILIVLFCAMMILSDGHTNPHVWILLGSTSIIPGSFGGTALRLAAKGWNDDGRSNMNHF